MKEYYFRQYDFQNPGPAIIHRLNFEGRIEASNLKEAQKEVERQNGCASMQSGWEKEDKPTRHWIYTYNYALNRWLTIELFPSEEAMLKKPVHGEKWIAPNGGY